MMKLGTISAQCPKGFPFIAELHHKPTATGMLFVFDDVAILGGASTLPEDRQQGAQQALLSARLHWAADQGAKKSP